MLKLIIFIALYFFERIFVYKLLKKIDKKERLKVNKIEEQHFIELEERKKGIES